MAPKKKTDPLVGAIKELIGVVKELKAEVRNGQGTSSKDDSTRVRPVRASGAPDQAVNSNESNRNGRASTKYLGGESDEDSIARQHRSKAAEVALNSGVDSAVSSYSPPDAPTGPPSRSNEEKILWEQDDVIPCQLCKQPVYVVKKRLTTKTLKHDLLHLLEPYSDKVPALKPETPVKSVGGVAFNCPLCVGAFGVIII